MGNPDLDRQQRDRNRKDAMSQSLDAFNIQQPLQGHRNLSPSFGDDVTSDTPRHAETAIPPSQGAHMCRYVRVMGCLLAGQYPVVGLFWVFLVADFVVFDVDLDPVDRPGKGVGVSGRVVTGHGRGIVLTDIEGLVR